MIAAANITASLRAALNQQLGERDAVNASIDRLTAAIAALDGEGTPQGTFSAKQAERYASPAKPVRKARKAPDEPFWARSEAERLAPVKRARKRRRSATSNSASRVVGRKGREVGFEPDEIYKIREAFAGGATQSELAKEFSVARGTILAVVEGTGAYRHYPVD